MERVKLKIYGMTCEDCKLKIINNLKNQEGIINVSISLNESSGELIIDETKINVDIIPNLDIFSARSRYRARVVHHEKI
ncbi:MAG: heavy-metal-associated domain-containing protein [Thermoplasmata archaeon]